jgi:hypothetical protein
LSLVCLGAMVIANPLLSVIYAAILVVAWLLFLAFVPPAKRTTF